MFPSLRVQKPEELEFKWVKKKDIQLYESFRYDGVVYSLYDCVCLYKKGESKPYIGKLVEIWENADKSKQINVQWFFRPEEIYRYLGDADMQKNELFLASGRGIGLANINPMEALSGKCNVICISTDSRNPQPSAEELLMADFVFHRTFDVERLMISDQIGDIVGCLPVEFVFNRRDSDKTPIKPKLDPNNRHDEKHVMESEDTLRLAGKRPREQLNTWNLDENCNHIIKKKGTDAKQDKAKKVIVLGERDRVEKRGKSIWVSNELEDAPSKRAKLNDIVTSPQDRCRNSVQSSPLSGNDTAPLVICAVSYKAQPESELVKGLTNGPDIDVKLTEKLSVRNEKLSKTSVALSKDNRKFGCVGNAARIENEAESTDYLEIFDKGPIGERSKPGNGKDLGGAENLSPHIERPSISHVVSPNETSSCGCKKDIGGPGEAAKLVKDSSSLTRRALTTIAHSKGNPNLEHDDCREKDNVTWAKDSCLVEERAPKKAKCEDSKISGRHDKVNGKKLEETWASKTKKSLIMVDDKVNSRPFKNSNGLGEGPKERDDKTSKLLDRNLSKLHVATSNNDTHSKFGCRAFEVTRRPVPEKSKWFGELPWEENMRSAYGEGRVVLLQNLDPEYTSGDVEDIIWHAFKEYGTARMVQHTAISSPHYGQAFFIFKNRRAAESVVEKLDSGCLMLSKERPLVASTEFDPQLPGSSRTKFVGHLSIDKVRRHERREDKEAVSTSHYAQDNTVEYGMAMDWWILYYKCHKCWRTFYKEQERELMKLVAHLKSK